jgi:hypothetical protein
MMIINKEMINQVIYRLISKHIVQLSDIMNGGGGFDDDEDDDAAQAQKNKYQQPNYPELDSNPIGYDHFNYKK